MEKRKTASEWYRRKGWVCGKLKNQMQKAYKKEGMTNYINCGPQVQMRNDQNLAMWNTVFQKSSGGGCLPHLTQEDMIMH